MLRQWSYLTFHTEQHLFLSGGGYDELFSDLGMTHFILALEIKTLLLYLPTAC